MPAAQSENSPVFFRITNTLNELEDDSDETNGRVVILPVHKKNAITIGLSKMPIAMSTAYTSSNIQSAFRDNGQLDYTNFAMPNVDSLIGTYRGSISSNHYLKNSDKIIQKNYKEAYLNGKIQESSYDAENIDNDKDTYGNIISRDFSISKENCQRSKVLSAQT